MTKTIGGVKSGEINRDPSSQMRSQWVLNDDVIIHTWNLPEKRTDNSWSADYTSRSVWKGDFQYVDGSFDYSQSTISESGNFFYQIMEDGSTQETGYGYKFPSGTTFAIGNADDAASYVTFSYSNDESTNWGSSKVSSFPISRDRSAIKSSGYEKYAPNGWGDDPFSIYDNKRTSGSDNSREENNLIVAAPSKFNKKSADKITNFNPSTDTLEIDTDSFGIDSSATFASGKNKKAVKKKLAKQDFDFLYDEKKGGLYFNENGADKGFGEGGIIAVLRGSPDLTSGNLEFI